MTRIEDAYRDWISKAPGYIRQDTAAASMLEAAFYAGAYAKRDQDSQIVEYASQDLSSTEQISWLTQAVAMLH